MQQTRAPGMLEVAARAEILAAALEGDYLEHIHGLPFRYDVRIQSFNQNTSSSNIKELLRLVCLSAHSLRVHAIDRFMLQFNPIPNWAVESVFLCPDFFSHIFSLVHLPATSRVCKAWNSWWTAQTCIDRAVGLKPLGRTWREEWADMWMERVKVGTAVGMKSKFEAHGKGSIEVSLKCCNIKSSIDWKLEKKWLQEDAEAFTLICACVSAPLATAVFEQSNRFAASTHTICDILARVSKKTTGTAPDVYTNLTGRFGLATDDFSFGVLRQPGVSVGLSFVTSGVTKGTLSDSQYFPNGKGYYRHVRDPLPCFSLIDSDVVCFRSAPTDADGYHSMIQVNKSSYALPPLAKVTLESIQYKNEWQINGHCMQQRLLTFSVTFT